MPTFPLLVFFCFGLALVGLSDGPIPRAVLKPEDQISYYIPVGEPAFHDISNVRIHILLSDQRLQVVSGSDVIAWTDITSGAPYSPTPIGKHHVLEKHQEYRSALFDVDMPNAIFLTEEGIAMHGGHLLEAPMSGGCIRLPFDFARWLFPLVEIGTEVTIT